MFASLISALERILYSCLDCHVNLNHLKSELLVWITIEDVKLCLIVLIICTCNYLKYKYVDLGLWDIFNHFYRRNMIIEYAVCAVLQLRVALISIILNWLRLSYRGTNIDQKKKCSFGINLVFIDTLSFSLSSLGICIVFSLDPSSPHEPLCSEVASTQCTVRASL